MSHYFRFLANVGFILISFGFVLPWLVSMPDTLLVIAGMVYMFLAVPTILYYFNRAYLTSILNKLKGNSNV